MAEPGSRTAREPVDPDVDLRIPADRAETRRGMAPVVGAVAIGGVIGSSARYGAALIWPTAGGAFPWTTMIVNVVGCAIIGAFMVLITEKWTPHPLVRPFFGTGVLGGFTTFSTYATDVRRLADGGHPRIAVAYLGLTLLAALLAVAASATLTRRLVGGSTPDRQETR
ncbi:CrcB protein [Streptomyces sp. DvalAA-14]|uniref:fluoride efflux transporter FluC n=1 Tax=unclassified Streptomyces TaxID=2593676 RepID=UPI00081B738F|nr:MULTISPECIES: CrcB family protein [unclassified Streptomyces]MYS20202.1 CrcB protein [Streptomyces sp. SID4948]SCD63359.1 CrcB protein [Streptomyces sp. DvalAA-14]